MTTSDSLGAFEQVVLLALLRLGDDAYGMTVRREIEARTARTIALGAVYATLDRLEEKGYVKSHAGAGSEARGGRARRFFKVQAKGVRALKDALVAVDRLRAGLGGVLGMEGVRP